jgi:hypothetical protein
MKHKDEDRIAQLLQLIKKNGITTRQVLFYETSLIAEVFNKRNQREKERFTASCKNKNTYLYSQIYSGNF